jgi:hypothetical protein
LKKSFPQKVQDVLSPDVPLERVGVWFQDEMRIGQRGTQTRIWARKGSRPRIVRQQQSESAYIFGAVCAQRDEAVGLVLPYANTKTMALHLEAFSLAIPPGRHAVLVLDQAGLAHYPKTAAVSQSEVVVATGWFTGTQSH